MTTSRTLRAVAAVIGGAVALSSCSLRVSDMSLPGGTDTGDSPILVKAEFDDVLDLVPQSTVKVNDVSVGKITDIRLDGETAVVTMELPSTTDLPDNTVAEIRQTSLLGEKFVQLSPPETEASSGQLESGDVIKLADTGRNPEVEEVLGALSLLLNGGGVAQLQTITRELNLALGGREESVKSAFRQIEDLTSQLDEGKADIVRAIEGLNRLSLSVSDQMGTIDAALQELPSALRTIDKQRGDLVRMLRSLNELSDVGVRVIQASKQSTIESFRQLVLVLTKFSESGDAFVDAFHVFLTYPFVDEVVGRDPQVARTLQMGDYTNLSVTLDVALKGGGDSINAPGGSGDPIDVVCTDLKELEKLDQLPPLSKLCKKAKNKVQKCLDDPSEKNCGDLPGFVLEEACQDLVIPICSVGGGGGGGGGGGPDLPDLPDLPGVGRAPFGDPTRGPPTGRGPTMGEMMQTYDPDLVSLLVSGMVMTR